MASWRTQSEREDGSGDRQDWQFGCGSGEMEVFIVLVYTILTAFFLAGEATANSSLRETAKQGEDD